MVTNIDGLHLRRVLGRDDWTPPAPHGPDGWRMLRRDGTGSVIVTCAPHDGIEWIHASIAYSDHDPSYADLAKLHRAVWNGRGYAYQVFAPPDRHVNIHEHALHLWGRLDGRGTLPDFAVLGTI